jgi:hypothetical protein
MGFSPALAPAAIQHQSAVMSRIPPQQPFPHQAQSEVTHLEQPETPASQLSQSDVAQLLAENRSMKRALGLVEGHSHDMDNFNVTDHADGVKRLRTDQLGPD